MDKKTKAALDMGMDELEAAAKQNGIQEGSQMSRFLLWVGNECYEGREASDLAVLIERMTDLVAMFLEQGRR